MLDDLVELSNRHEQEINQVPGTNPRNVDMTDHYDRNFPLSGLQDTDTDGGKSQTRRPYNKARRLRGDLDQVFTPFIPDCDSTYILVGPAFPKAVDDEGESTHRAKNDY